MRRALLLLAFFATPLLADDPTADLLSAIPVQDVIRFEVPNKSTVIYRVDNKFSGSLEEKTSPTFAAPHGVDLTFADYNPFMVVVTSTEASVLDPNQKAIGDFLDALTAFSKGIAPGPAQASAQRIAANMQLSRYAACYANFDQLSAPELNGESIAEVVNRWIGTARGQAGIAAVRREAAELRKSVAAEVAKAEAAQAKVSAGSCTPATSNIIDMTNLIASNKELIDTLDAIIKMLDGYLARTWRNGNSVNSDLLIRNVGTDPANQKNVGLTFSLQTYTFDAKKNTITAAASGEATRALILRNYRRFVPEVGIAAIYNELKYPKYTADKQADGTFLVKKETSGSNVDAAMTLNMFCNCFGGNAIFPGFQIGVSTAKDYPGAMAGGVLRFAQPKKLSVAFGRMITWYKDLDKLEVGKPVASQEALDKDLKRKRSPAAWYFGVQYTF